VAIKLGTRGSTLAMIQAHNAAELLTPIFGDVEIVKIKTSGDAGNRDRLGAFVSEIQTAIGDRTVDIGLHCLKDLPTTRPNGLTLGAHLLREDARDAVLTRVGSWLDLPRRSVVGTGSLRRTSQLASHRPDLTFRPLVGNVDSRLGKLLEGEYDAIVLAVAGLKRLNLWDEWKETRYGGLEAKALEFSTMLPAPGQGVLVLECRSDDGPTLSALSKLNDSKTELAATAERAFLSRFGGGCSVPVAAYGEFLDENLTVSGLVASPDGTHVLRGSKKGDPPQASALGLALAEELGEKGAFEIVEDSVSSPRGALLR
jgi:hydroxymethylbilane synthase